MARHVAFLRGINVGNRRLKGPEICSCLAAAGLREVATFRASGNVVFSSDAALPEPELVGLIEGALQRGLGYPVPTFLRSETELLDIARRRPFAPEAVAASAGKLQVSLLATQPGRRVREAVLELATAADLLALEARELYWLPSGGILESALDQRQIEALLGPSTRRTMGTIEQIAIRYFS